MEAAPQTLANPQAQARAHIHQSAVARRWGDAYKFFGAGEMQSDTVWELDSAMFSHSLMRHSPSWKC